MDIVTQLVQTLPDFFVITLLTIGLFFLCYGVVRLLHLSNRWIFVGIGTLLFLFILLRVAPPILRQPQQLLSNMAAIGSMLGLISVVCACYAFGQWTTRGGYRLIKRWGRSSMKTLARQILLFLRSSHRFFGWGVLIAATIHLLFYLPLLATMTWYTALIQPAVVTGIFAWIVLAFLVGLGLWIDYAMKLKYRVRWKKLMHIGTAFGFFLFTILHIATKLKMH